MTLPERFRDRDVFQDTHGKIFVTLGHIQPSERVISYLKYVPHPSGLWIADETRYRRVFSNDIRSVIDGMKLVLREYLACDKHMGTTLIEVPKDSIVRYFSPESRLAEILSEGPRDKLEAAAKTIASALHDGLGIPFSAIGVTGSIAWKAHDINRSDINMNIYGFHASWRLELGGQAVADASPAVHMRRGTDWSMSISNTLRRIPHLSRTDMLHLYNRRTAFKCCGKFITVMPVLHPDEAPITHGTERYSPVTNEPVSVEIEVETDTFGIFFPGVYGVRTQPLDLIDGQRIRRILVYDGSFRGVLRQGDRAVACGMLQYVTPAVEDGSDSFYQLMIGTMAGNGREYVSLSGLGK